MCILIVNYAHSQVSIANNSWLQGRYVGFDVSNGINPLLFKTNAINRMKLNGLYTSGSNQYAIDGFTFGATANNINTSGYLLLGPENTNGTFYTTKGAYSALHIKGNLGGFVQELGYRPWMRTGITLTDNQDLSYFGLRQVGTGFDITETTMTWADNSSTANGPDDFVFRFTGGNWSGSANTTNNDLRTISDNDGLHIGRFTGDGLFGLGNTFGIQNTSIPANLYVRPQSIFHLSYDRQANAVNERFGFMQVTLRDAAIARGTGETEFDGLRFGIDNDVLTTAGTTYLNSYLRWQENTPFIVQTDWDNAAGGVEAGERIRVSTTASPGVPATLLNAVNTTRVAIPYNGNVPITTPNALLNLGTNPVSNFSRYMDDGVLTSLLSTNLFTGISPVNYVKAPLTAVVGFGGSDLVFMNSNTSSNLSNNDKICVRIDKTTNNVGIGNFGQLGSINNAPSERIDVEGNGRFRDIPAQGGQSLILGLQISTTNPNDVELSRLGFNGSSSSVLLGNGTWGNLPSSSFGYLCTNTTSTSMLQGNSHVDLNGHNFFFNSGTPTSSSISNNVGIGDIYCNSIFRGKLDVYQNGGTGTAGYFITNGGGAPRGVAAIDNSTNINGIGLYAASNNLAAYFNGTQILVGSTFVSSDIQLKHDIHPINNALSILDNLKPKQYFMDTLNNLNLNVSPEKQFGFIAQEVEQVLPNLVKDFQAPEDSLAVQSSSSGSFKAVNYIGLIPINTQAIKELNAIVTAQATVIDSLTHKLDEVNKRLSKLEDCLSNLLPSLCEANATYLPENQNNLQNKQSENVKLSSLSSIVLYQNNPNPFNETTDIMVTIPVEVKNAQLKFFSINGTLIKEYTIEERGTSKLKIDGNELINGIYTYSLIIDGKEFATKKMIKQ